MFSECSYVADTVPKILHMHSTVILVTIREFSSIIITFIQMGNNEGSDEAEALSNLLNILSFINERTRLNLSVAVTKLCSPPTLPEAI